MANINETIAEVEKLNPELAGQIKKYVKEHAYGLVYEKNLPEAVRLYKKAVCVGDTVNILPPRGQVDKEENYVPWHVQAVNDGVATLRNGDETRDVPVEDVAVLVSWRDVIYPGLKEIDRVERGNPDDPYHMVINAENYHALEALTYAYAGKVDCIYIDPPYNTGAKDWKYNNDYVAQEDKYRHSKWLAFMERRLQLAGRLLNPKDSVLIVTIDEKEYLRLGMLLEQMFPEARIQMISSVINTKGAVRFNQFSRTDEYIFFVCFGNSKPVKLCLDDDWLIGNSGNTKHNRYRWQPCVRANQYRVNSPSLFFPVFVNAEGTKVIRVGDSLPKDFDRSNIVLNEGEKVIFPINTKGEEAVWHVSKEKFESLYRKGYIRLGQFNNNGMSISYMASGMEEKLDNGTIPIVGRNKDGSVIFDIDSYDSEFIPGTQWNIKRHDATEYGTKLLKKIIGNRFSYPKSLYAVEDVLRFFVANKPNALIVDFFAGSGTTAHATMLLNHLDGGRRRCISVTNNEVSAEEEKKFIKAGLRPYDEEWQKYGIARYITWERVKAAITGINTLGEPIKGDYKFTEEFPMSEGFHENAIFCELTYESAWPIRLDNAFDAIAPILWMQAGCQGPIIRKIGKSYLTTDYYGVLFDFGQASKFCERIKSMPSIKTVFVVTDDQRRFSNICRRLPGIEVHRLYETYLRTFEICGEGGLD